MGKELNRVKFDELAVGKFCHYAEAVGCCQYSNENVIAFQPDSVLHVVFNVDCVKFLWRVTFFDAPILVKYTCWLEWVQRDTIDVLRDDKAQA